MALKLDQRATGLMRQARPLSRDRPTMLDELDVSQILAWLEVVVELPLLGGVQIREGDLGVEPESPKSTVNLQVLLTGEAKHRAA
jgi:hypothetical protein